METAHTGNLCSFFAPCPRGLENLLKNELQQHEIGSEWRIAGGGVAFKGSVIDAYKANLQSRLATRILWEISQFNYSSIDDIYAQTLLLPWESWFPEQCTIRVNLTAFRTELTSLNFTILRVKDAICDRFRQTRTIRPNVDTLNPDIRIQVLLESKRATLLLDTSGEPLWKRGWRKAPVEAPIKENLAAGLLLISGWQAEQPILDPMCGSGTIIMEAITMAMQLPPGVMRGFAFEKMHKFQAEAWKNLCHEAKLSTVPLSHNNFIAADNDPRALQAVRENMHANGWQNNVQILQQDVQLINPEMFNNPPPGCLVTNPPYGVRIGEKQQLNLMYPKIGDNLKQNFPGWKCFFFSADPDLAKGIGLRPDRKINLKNGALDCQFINFNIVRGSNRIKYGV